MRLLLFLRLEEYGSRLSYVGWAKNSTGYDEIEYFENQNVKPLNGKRNRMENERIWDCHAWTKQILK